MFRSISELASMPRFRKPIHGQTNKGHCKKRNAIIAIRQKQLFSKYINICVAI